MEGVKFILRQIRMTAANVIFSFLLMGVEKILELGYRCPGSIGLRRAYILAFFIIPFFSVIILGYYFQTHVFEMTAEEKKKKFRLLLHSLVPACIWIVILLLDGKYIECLFYSEAENCPKEDSCDSNVSAISKICGMGLLLAVVLGSCIYVGVSIKTTSFSGGTEDSARVALDPSALSQGGHGGDHRVLEMRNIP